MEAWKNGADFWRKGATVIPDIKPGHEAEFIVAVRRGHNGKVYSFAAMFLNAYPLNYEHGCPRESDGCDGMQCEDGCPTTGWFSLTGDDDGDGRMYHKLSIAEGDEFLGWRPVPQWPA